MLVIMPCNLRIATVLRQTFCNIALTNIDNTPMPRRSVPDDVYALIITIEYFLPIKFHHGASLVRERRLYQSPILNVNLLEEAARRVMESVDTVKALVFGTQDGQPQGAFTRICSAFGCIFPTLGGNVSAR